jgi:CheY-like chemotaxis protein
VRVLVADDNLDVLESLISLLEMSGHEVHGAEDGERALEEAARFHPEVAILDINMPKLNGYDVAQGIRAEPWGRHATLIAHTAWDGEHDKRRAYEAGFDTHLAKPAEFSAFMRLLEARANGTN